WGSAENFAALQRLYNHPNKDIQINARSTVDTMAARLGVKPPADPTPTADDTTWVAKTILDLNSDDRIARQDAIIDLADKRRVIANKQPEIAKILERLLVRSQPPETQLILQAMLKWGGPENIPAARNHLGSMNAQVQRAAEVFIKAAEKRTE